MPGPGWWPAQAQLVRTLAGQGVPSAWLGHVRPACFAPPLNPAHAYLPPPFAALGAERTPAVCNPNIATYAAAITACAKLGDWERALRIHQEMVEG